MNIRLGQNYISHKVFEQSSNYSNFYRDLAFNVIGFVPMGTSGIINLDTYVYSSIQGTIGSIRDVLLKGRISDSFTLLRKYYDSTIINIYSDIYLKDQLDLNNFIVKKIDNWVNNKESLPEYRIMSQYIQKSEKLKPLNELLLKNNLYKNIRNRCNDHTHYNFFSNVLINDSELYYKDRIKVLDLFSSDLESLFIQHISYIIFLNQHYIMSSDYTDSLDIGMKPEKDSHYWVAPFAKTVFDEIIKIKRPDIANLILLSTSMNL